MTQTNLEKYQKIRFDSTTFMINFLNSDKQCKFISFQDQLFMKKRISSHVAANFVSLSLSIPLAHYGYPLLNKYVPGWLLYLGSHKYIRYGVLPFVFVVTNYGLSEKCLSKNYKKLDKKYNFTFDDYQKLQNMKIENKNDKQLTS